MENDFLNPELYSKLSHSLKNLMWHCCQCQIHSGDLVRVWKSCIQTIYPICFSVIRILSFWFVSWTREKIPLLHEWKCTQTFVLCQIMTTNSIWTLKTFIFLILSFFFSFLQGFLAVSLLAYLSKYLCWSVWVVFMLTKRNYVATDSA